MLRFVRRDRRNEREREMREVKRRMKNGGKYRTHRRRSKNERMSNVFMRGGNIIARERKIKGTESRMETKND
jgi:hypothetical protein